ncbi:hypothetical protein [Opitutus terrae]|uniref:Uncharacterized protein n=1 Tax=Opitutus terrae (strain DSM 11246 / JCM 15787 / PB90-1) TaxID=452637 RepID=B1ZME7_OPITP|nr:hypothetical protein [Opitutus terrae]ACB73400.1 hypothetical protein Oter_0109 [Opitutus terrae PB90-1]
MISLRSLLLFVVALSLGVLARADDEVRHSKSLSAAEFASAGLDQLSSDQLAVLDALVRRDLTQAQLVSKTPRAARFSERLSADERRNAGLEQLSDEELARVDATVAARIAPPAGVFSASGIGPTPPIQSWKIRRDPEIHGSATLMVAAGSHGYRAYGGALDIYYVDPTNKFTIGVGLSEVRSKGGLYRGYWNDCYLYDEPFRGLNGHRW